MKKLKNVVSCFDGISCLREALNRSNISYEKYYASEIDKKAIEASMNRFPDTIQLGDVRNVSGYDFKDVDLLAGGSPCQSFSFAGKRKGMATECEIDVVTYEQYTKLKNDGFEFTGQSYLFWEFVRLLHEIKPKYFFLENVEMGEKWERVISRALGVNGIHINSALVSAQHRRRIYWTNIGLRPAGLFGDMESIIKQPKDRGILLKHILQKDVPEKYYLSEKMLKYFENRAANFNNGKVNIREEEGKATTLTASMASCDISDNFIAVGLTEVRTEEAKKIRRETGTYIQELEPRFDNKTNTLTSVQKDNLIIQVNPIKERRIIQHIIPEIVNVRKHEVDIDKLQDCLKKHKKISNKEIAKTLSLPVTMVEHWFRTDTYFSIPDKDIWISLKTLLSIETDEFDDSIMLFEQRESVFEKTNRVYDEDGIAPTLTSTGADERVLVREVKQINPSKESAGKQPYQQNRIYNPEGIAPALCSQMTGGSNLIIEDVSMTQRGRGFNKGGEKAIDGKTPPLTSNSWEHNNHLVENIKIRRLTPIEVCRLQGLPDDYFFKDGKQIISDSAIYKCVGNAWQVDTIVHIFEYLHLEP